MATHDPKTTLETLRDHLTHPNTNVVFLFGAGTSCAVRIPVDGELGGEGELETRSLIPNVAELTKICRREIGKLDPEGEATKFATALGSIEAEIQATGRQPNIEDVLSCVRRKLHAVGEADLLAGLNRAELGQMEETIRKTIAAQVNPDRSNFPVSLPHESFVRWVARMPRNAPVEVFTTNYDVLLETAFDAERVPSFDGFVGCGRPFFCHDSLSRPESVPGPSWSRLWKIHGSITWAIDTIKGHPRVIRTEPHSDGEMIMPSHHKYDESRKQPYTALLDRLTKVLEREDTILVVCGYSFSDEHINAIIFDALEARKRPHVIALQFGDPADEDVLVVRAKRLMNLVVLGPTAAIIRGEKGEWKFNDPRSAPTFQDAFLADPAPEEGKPLPGTGKLLLGDFAQFCEFVGSLAGPS